MVIIFEHQSTINENMPLRILLYIARIYEKITEEDALYQKALIKLPQHIVKQKAIVETGRINAQEIYKSVGIYTPKEALEHENG